MKKIFIYLLIFILVCFAIPIIFTSIMKKEVSVQIAANIDLERNNEQNENNQNLIENEKYDYKNYNIVKLLHTSTNEIEQLYLDEYLYGVVSSEMPASFEEEALKAQAIVARTYTIYKIQNNANKHEAADICDNSACCQAWISKEDRLNKWEENSRQLNWNKIENAVKSTSGKIITYDGKPINAFFHSNSGGKTETTINVWGGSNYPYLQSVSTAGEDSYSQYYSELTISKQTFIDKIKEKHSDFQIDFTQEKCMEVIEYTQGNRIKNIKIGNIQLSGVEIRTIFGLKSANFNIKINADNIEFKVIGYGHGVGMSQTGADSMAKEGKKCEDIIKHFYTGVEIINL